ncbi:hypothetical protein C8A05DRAFT_36590, partial [Staphylotrichum tortipilum]
MEVDDGKEKGNEFGEGDEEEAGPVPGLKGGWRRGVALNVLGMFLVLITGFVCLIIAISGVPLGAGRSAIFVGGCGTTVGIDMGLHVVISVFVVGILAAANYAFQVLGSPTREEVDAAHTRRDWLDVGVPSLRNLGRIAGRRAVLAVLLVTAAVLTQVLYNAVVYVSDTAPNFKAALVSESFVGGAPFANDIPNNMGRLSRPDLLILQQLVGRDELIRLSTARCIGQFGGAFQTDYSAVLLISQVDTPVLIQTAVGADTAAVANILSNPSSIQHCLALPAAPPTCEVNLNASLLGSVALLNSITLVATAAILFKRPSSFRPLATLGDAISSFLDDPDPTTQGACLLTKSDVLHGRWPLTEAKYWVPSSQYWLRSVSSPGWIATVSIWAVSVGLVAAALAFSITYDPSSRLSPFGAASPHALLPLPQSTTLPPAAAVVASLPQLLLALLYLATNALLTTYHLSHESALFATPPA